jgi:hypothetical protein
MAGKKAKKNLSKKDLKKTKGGLLPAVNVVSPTVNNTSIKIQDNNLGSWTWQK